MKELLYGWIRDIAFYTLLMEVVLHVLPEQGQRKYLQFFMGIVLIILVISPALSAAGLDRKLDETYVRQTYDQELQEFWQRQQEIEEGYERRLEERVEEAADELEALEEDQDGTGSGQETEESENDMEIPEIRIELGEPEET
ncbi:MAG TPA: stage III sporulation protein AF [Candidatus Merdisoma merdipullorum]|nr:stage III sporulation protein AF [Candidatus Merdisoma merdipullorum]